jgi:hypothetical protein
MWDPRRGLPPSAAPVSTWPGSSSAASSGSSRELQHCWSSCCRPPTSVRPFCTPFAPEDGRLLCPAAAAG